MAEAISDPPYKVTLDEHGNVAGITSAADGRTIPIDPTSREYCQFITWAAKQEKPVGFSFERLDKNALYLAREDDLIALCKERGVVLFCHDYLGDGRWKLETGLNESPNRQTMTSIIHASGSVANGANGDRVFFYRLYSAFPTRDAATVDSVDDQHGIRLPVFVTHTLLAKLEESLMHPDSDVRRLSCWPVEKTFVYVDISGFSQHKVGQQLLIINALIQVVKDQRWWKGPRGNEAQRHLESSLCIGDGYIFVFGTPWTGVHFAGHLAALLEALVAYGMYAEFHFRISVHTGPVYRFWDKWGPGKDEGRWNYVGRGITDGERVLSAIGKDRDDIVFVSSATRQRMLTGQEFIVAEIRQSLYNRGRQADKHGEFRRVYELDHTRLMAAEVARMIVEETFQTTEPNGRSRWYLRPR